MLGGKPQFPELVIKWNCYENGSDEYKIAEKTKK